MPDPVAFPLLQKLITDYPDLAECTESIGQAFAVLRRMYQSGGKLLICGNGGSAADSDHIVGELMKSFALPRPLPDDVRRKLRTAFPQDGDRLGAALQGALPAISLVSQAALMTAYANDVDPEMVFAQQVYGYGVPGDTVLGISTSGNSKNVIRALQVGRALGLHTIGLTGRSGGQMKALCDVTICVPADAVPAVQERHLPIYHTLCLMLEQAFFGS